MTRDRPETLKRCIETALLKLGADDALTVIDDSCPAISQANSAFLTQVARYSLTQVAQLRAEKLHDQIALASGGHKAQWQARTAQRDIAPLRNLTLLLSVAVDALTTILVDDDMYHYDLEATHLLLDSHYRMVGPMLIGAEIGGTSELDTLTRLSDALGLLESKSQNSATTAEELFRACPNSHSRRAAQCQYLSGGYLAFRLPTTGLFAFPPGYNEDWLWCLLHVASGRARLLRDNQTVEHEPPELRQATCDDILFEIAGDLIFDCLAEAGDERTSGPESILESLAVCVPDVTMIPWRRAEAVIRRALKLRENGLGGALPLLECHGLGFLRNMLDSGELELDCSEALKVWSADAVAKHKTFARTLEDVNARQALREAIKEGKK